MSIQDPIYIAGHRGLVGSSLWRYLGKRGCTNLIGAASKECDLRNPASVEELFSLQKPRYVVLAAARVGGIGANSARPAEFCFDNLAISLNVLDAARRHGVERLIYLGSSCIYPKLCPQPIKESFLLSGPLEPTNRPYAVAKIAGVELCASYNRQYGTDFISLMPTNLYGPNDNYDLHTSHVIPAILRKAHEAKVGGGPLRLWGSGKPLREFLYSDDLSAAIYQILTLERPLPSLLNVGSGEEVTIRTLAEKIAHVVGYKGEIVWDESQPDGTPRKLLDSSQIHSLGWRPQMTLDEGLPAAYADFLRKLPV